jgi:hemerythrin-like domain-containing protein
MSDDHAHALAVAQKLKQAGETSAAAARSAFLEFWEQGGKHHFQVEETVVLPAWARHGAVDHQAIVQMLTEHIDLRRRAADVAADEEPPLADLHELGERFERHVWLEERAVIPLVFHTLPGEELLELQAAVEAA